MVVNLPARHLFGERQDQEKFRGNAIMDQSGICPEAESAVVAGLAYQGAAHGWGPQFKRVYFADEAKQGVVVEYENVQDALTLSKGWRQGFALSRKQPPLPADLTKTANLVPQHTTFENPVAAEVLGKNKIVLRFAQPIGETAAVSFAASANAQLGLHRRWGLEFGGVQDGSGHQATAFMLAPIAPRRGLARRPRTTCRMSPTAQANKSR